MADEKTPQVPVAKIKTALGYEKLGEFREGWKELTDADKAQIRQGIADGSMTY